MKIGDGSITYTTYTKVFSGSSSAVLYFKMLLPDNGMFLIQSRGGETVLVSGCNTGEKEYSVERLITSFDKLGGYKFANGYLYFYQNLWGIIIRLVNLLYPVSLPDLVQITELEYNSL